jgi:hypothetical protein
MPMMQNSLAIDFFALEFLGGKIKVGKKVWIGTCGDVRHVGDRSPPLFA